MTTTTKQTQQNYLVPFIIMVVLMALVGLITNLNQQFQAPMKAAYLLLGGANADTLATSLNFAFFLAYLVMGPASANYIGRKGYKPALLLGLSILCISFLIYMSSAWVFDNVDINKFQGFIDEARGIEDLTKQEGIAPGDALQAAQTQAALTGNFQVQEVNGEYNGLLYTKGMVIPVAYWVFLLGSFVAGTALTYLQAVINPYIVACDVKGTTGVQRQSIAGTGNSLMTTLGPIFVAYVIFSGKDGLDISLNSLYIPFLVLLVLVAALAFSLTKIHLPEVAGGGGKSEHLPESVWSFSHLKLGLIALFCYVGVEVCVGANVVLFAQGDLGFALKDAALMASLYWGGLLVGRFASSFLNKVSAQLQLLVAASGAILLIVLAMITKIPWFLCGVGIFHSIMWPAIFALAIDGLGRYTSKASGVLMMGCFGGALFPVIQGILKSAIGSWNPTWLFVVLGELFILYYAISGHKVKKTDTGVTTEM